MAYEIPSLKLTASVHLKMDDWKIQFPVGVDGFIFTATNSG